MYSRIFSFLVVVSILSCSQSGKDEMAENSISINEEKSGNSPASKYEFEIENSCGFDKSLINQKVYSFDSDLEAENALKSIMRLTGLPANFEIRSASVPNACAVIKCDDVGNCDRFILYNQEFMERVKDETTTSFSELAILAHEIAHHLSGHTLSNTGSSYDMELEADKFAGFMLYKLGASIEETKKAYSTLSPNGSKTHPPRSARVAAVTNGWYDAKRNGEKVTPLGNVDVERSGLAESTKPQSNNQLKVGDEYQGGVIAYLFSDLDKEFIKNQYGTSYTGIIAAPYDQSTGIEWGQFDKEYRRKITSNGWKNVYIDESLGAAEFNSKRADNSALASRLCSMLNLNGYSDWFLPSQDELWKLYSARHKIGGFREGYYWSSTPDKDATGILSEKYSMSLNFSIDADIRDVSQRRSAKCRVRAIRYF